MTTTKSARLSVAQLDKRYLGRGEEAEDVQVVRSEGDSVIDARGRRYLDFFMGWCCGNLGWAHEEIDAAIRGFRGPSYVAPGYLYRPWAELAALLAELTPGDLQRCWRATGGTEAV